jgi:REP element-mobilizing transposase RayT
MPQSLSKVLVHLIFSTKHREPLIGPEIRPRLHAYLVGILASLNSPSLQTGGVADHVHILFALGRTITQADVVEEVKKSSSKGAEEAWRSRTVLHAGSANRCEDAVEGGTR